MKKTYFLFGKDASDEYEENGVDGVLSQFNKNTFTYEVFQFTEGDLPQTLFAAYEGWEAWRIITKVEFDKLN